MFINLFGIIALGHVVSSLPPGDSPGERYAIKNASDVEFSHPKIFNGKDAKLGEFPWMVQLANNSDNGTELSHSCGASIIDRQWILTAALCFLWAHKEKVDTFILAGSIQSIGSSATIRRVGKWFIHPAYSWKWDSPTIDVALIKLNKPLQFDRLICSIHLACFEVNPGTIGTISGWGSNGVQKPAPILQKANVTLGEINSCVEEWNAKQKEKIQPSLKPSLICKITGPRGETSFKGDSGGSVIQYDQQGIPHQIGVNSFGEMPPRKLSFSMKVSSFREWIKKTINEN